MVEEINYKGQVSIWVIVGILLVAALIIFFSINREIIDIPLPSTSDPVDPTTFVNQCVEKYVEEAVDIILPQGGFLNPRNYVEFYDEQSEKIVFVEFVCKTTNNYNRCINQHPLLLQEMKEEIRKSIAPKLEECFNELKKEVINSGGKAEIENENARINIDWFDDLILLNIEKKLTIEKREQTQHYNNYEVRIASPAHNLAFIVAEIAMQEARYCYFENFGFSIAYPRYEVSKFSMSEPIDVYTVLDKETGKHMITAVRSCAIPAGI